MSSLDQDPVDDVHSSSDDSMLLEKELHQSTREDHLTRLRKIVSRRIDQDAFLGAFVHYSLMVLKFLVPSFLQHLLDRRRHRYPEEGTAPSSTIVCLDGLRGVACLIVFNFHFLYPYSKTIFHGYGAEVSEVADRPNYFHYHQLPIISLLYRGRAMVAIFFAISGYVLSRKFLKLVNAHNHAPAYKALSSAVFRRGFRLFLPVTAGNLLVALAIRLGWYDGTEAVLRGDVTLPGDTEPRDWITGRGDLHPVNMGSLSKQLVHCYHHWAEWINPWRWDHVYNEYDPHAWTIPLEFRSSMILFLALVGTAGLKEKWRLGAIVVLFTYCLKALRWEVALFLGGVVLAQIDLMLGTFEALPSRSVLGRIAQWILCLFGFYFLSFPDLVGEVTPGVRYLSSITPEGYDWLYLFWHTIGAVILVHSVTNVLFLRRLFERPTCLYLGKISFAFYLVHGPILTALGLTLMPRIWRITGYGGGYGSNAGFVTGLALGWCLLLCFSVWLGDIFWRLVDVPCTKLARQIELWHSG